MLTPQNKQLQIFRKPEAKKASYHQPWSFEYMSQTSHITPTHHIIMIPGSPVLALVPGKEELMPQLTSLVCCD